MDHMTFTATPLVGLYTIHTRPVADKRGRLVRVFCEDEFAAVHGPLRWQQINLSRTSGKGSIRGMHYQHPPAAETKLVRCLRGKVFDVAVDIRRDSSTFLGWHGVELTADNDMMMLIPEGFAHGFQVLEDEAELLYMHSAMYSPPHDGRLRFDEPRVGIAWPLPPGMISERDLATPKIDDTFVGASL